MPVHHHQTFARQPDGTTVLDTETVEVVPDLRITAPVPDGPDEPVTIPADGTTTVTIEHTDAAETGTVTFDVNGTPTDVPIAGHLATIDIAASQPGEVLVEAAGRTVTFTAEEV